MRMSDAIYQYDKVKEKAGKYLLARFQGAYEILDCKNSKSEQVLYIEFAPNLENYKCLAKRKPNFRVTLAPYVKRVLNLLNTNFSGGFISEPSEQFKAYGTCQYKRDAYLFQLSVNRECLIILIFRNQANSVETLFTQFIDGEFDSEISSFTGENQVAA